MLQRFGLIMITQGGTPENLRNCCAGLSGTLSGLHENEQEQPLSLPGFFFGILILSTGVIIREGNLLETIRREVLNNGVLWLGRGGD